MLKCIYAKQADLLVSRGESQIPRNGKESVEDDSLFRIRSSLAFVSRDLGRHTHDNDLVGDICAIR